MGALSLCFLAIDDLVDLLHCTTDEVGHHLFGTWRGHSGGGFIGTWGNSSLIVMGLKLLRYYQYLFFACSNLFYLDNHTSSGIFKI
eukprot:scaffold421271_cov66-Attheya_sp.AAC.1